MRYIVSLILISITFLISGCATKKKSGPSKLKKAYHNTTAYYNGYFNADLLIDESILALESQTKDNYNKVLDIYKYTSATNPQAIYPQLDKAIQKLTVAVHLHRISHWTDDCYLAIGQSQFLKQDYESAEETLEYFVQEFNADGTTKKKKNVKEDKPAPSTSAEKRKARSKASGPGDTGPKVSKEEEKESRDKLKEREAQIKDRKKSKGKTSAKDAAKIREQRKAAALERQKAADGTSTDSSEVAGTDAPAETEKSAVQDEKPKEVIESKKEDATKSEDKTASGDEYNPENYFMKHKPCYYEGVLWLAKTYIHRANYDNARMYLKQLENDPKADKTTRSLVAAVEAHSYLMQKNYNMAIIPLRKAIELADNKKDRARYNFILGQLLERAGLYEEAAVAFNKVVSMHQDYEMDFYARLGLIQNQQFSGKGSKQELISDLKGMLKERKYVEFKDQLHFSLAKIYLAEGDTDNAVLALEEAIKASAGNQNNTVEINYTIANLYFKQEKYAKAKTFYDTTLPLMPKTDERYPEVERYSKDLTDIATHLTEMEKQDSLLMIAAMTDDEKKELVKKLKAQREKEKLESEALAEKPKSTAPTTSAAFVSQQAGARPIFFAYDTRNQKKNLKDFEKKWGTRVLEDNWRRSLRAQQFAGVGNDSTANVAEITESEIQDYLKGVPSSPADFAAIDNILIESMAALGRLYREKLERSDKSAQILEELQRRYVGNKAEPDVFYLLYLDYIDLKNPAKSKYYGDQILEKYPASLYADILRDPDYFKKKREEANKLNTYYASTYEHFSSGRIEQAKDMVDQSTKLFGNDNILRAKFALLNAMCVGKLKGADDYMHALREVVAKYPNTEEQTRAREILRLLGQKVQSDTTAVTQDSTSNKLGDEYKVDDADLHYVLIIMQTDKMSLTDAKNKASNFTAKYFQNDKLNIGNIVLGDNSNAQIPVIVVRRFNNKSAAMKYFDGLKSNRKDFVEDLTWYEVFAISQSNYRTLVKNRTIEPYRTFFMNNYLNK
jgi:tetratricopeptide (TPR) repeat protein